MVRLLQHDLAAGPWARDGRTRSTLVKRRGRDFLTPTHTHTPHPKTKTPPQPSQSRGEDDREDPDAAVDYQLDVMRCLREVNADNNTVGWYQAATAGGAWASADLVDTFAAYCDSIPRCVCLVFDPEAPPGAARALRAVRLRPAFLEARRAAGSCGALGAAALKASGTAWGDVFDELPVSITTRPLGAALLARALGPRPALDEADAERLVLAPGAATGRTLDALGDCLDDLGAESARVSHYHRSVARQQQAAAAFAARRRQENAARRLAGEPPLPEEDPSLGKPVSEPTPLDGFLVTAQVAAYCDALSAGAAGALEKLELLEGLARAGGGREQ